MRRRLLLAALPAAALCGRGALADPAPEPQFPAQMPRVVSAPETWDLETDVLVIGGGAAGLSAALAAAQKGARVLLAEKMPECGGDTLVAGGYFNAVLPEDVQRGDSVELFERQMLKSAGGLADPGVVRVLARGAGDSFRWLEGVGVKFLPGPRLIFGSPFPRSRRGVESRGQGYVRALLTACLRKQVDVWTDTPAEALVLGGGRVRGAVLRRKGANALVRARRGVVIATGGYGANPGLLRAVAPGMEGLLTDSRPGATGEMMVAAAQAGAALVNLSQVECTPGAGSSGEKLVRLDLIPNRMIMVNESGRRFVDEEGLRSDLARAILAQAPSRVWSVADNDTVEGFDITIRKDLLRLSYAGTVLREKTPEALARRMEVDTGAFLQSIASMAAKRHLRTPPFWAVPVRLRVHVTLGGIRIDESARCLDAQGRPVPGLWAAGGATGNIHGANRLGGNGINTAVTFGRIAGASAAENA